VSIDHLEILVEELSMEMTLRALVPRIVPGLSFEIRTFNGKPDLLRHLPNRLKGYQAWSASGGLGVAVVVDRDNDDCKALMERLDAEGEAHGFALTSVTANTGGNLLNRIAVEELEAWFLGDPEAFCQAFSGVSPHFRSRATFRDSDGVTGGTAEAVGRLLRQAGHHKGGLMKVAAAQTIAPLMDPDRNDSVSFGKFRDGLRLMVDGAV
jgi:hypothetical protein